MGYFCHECHSKLYEANNKASDEIQRRRDNGEELADLLAEFENERKTLLKAGTSNNERDFILNSAIHICESLLDFNAPEAAGWKKNYSGFWVKKTEPKSVLKEQKMREDTEKQLKTLVNGSWSERRKLRRELKRRNKEQEGSK